MHYGNLYCYVFNSPYSTEQLSWNRYLGATGSFHLHWYAVKTLIDYFTFQNIPIQINCLYFQQRIYRGRHRNPGVTYQYTVDQRMRRQYKYRVSEWSACSVTCGVGYMRRHHECVDENNRKLIFYLYRRKWALSFSQIQLVLSILWHVLLPVFPLSRMTCWKFL